MNSSTKTGKHNESLENSNAALEHCVCPLCWIRWRYYALKRRALDRSRKLSDLVSVPYGVPLSHDIVDASVSLPRDTSETHLSILTPAMFLLTIYIFN